MALNAYIKKEEKPQANYLSSHFKSLEKEKQKKPKEKQKEENNKDKISNQ